MINQSKYLDQGENFMIDSNVSMVGMGAQNPETDKGGDQEMPHKAKITLTLSEFKYRKGFSMKPCDKKFNRRSETNMPAFQYL